MQSNGELADAAGFQNEDAILSGPAGGCPVGAARTARMAGLDHIIGFDMGGTSTDVALYAGGFELRAFETAVAGVRMRAPMMAVNTVAAGGGSILAFDGARFRVGPESAGADPGPACYRRGGPRRGGDGRQCLRWRDPAAALSGDLWAQRRCTARCRHRGGQVHAALAEEIERATGAAAQPRSEVAEGYPADRRREHGDLPSAGIPVQKGCERLALLCNASGERTSRGSTPALKWPNALGMEDGFIHPFAECAISAISMGLAEPDGHT